MQEIWKDIENFERRYQISNLGRVKSFPQKGNHKKEPFILKKNTNKSGYEYVTLYNKNMCKKFKVHRLVAQAFIPNPNNFNVINHKNENKNDNRVENLEWCNPKYNNRYSKSKKIYEYDNKGNLIKIWNSTREIEEILGIDHTTISYRCRHNNKIWRYSNAD